MAEPSTPRRGGTSIRAQLVALVLVVAIPLIGLVFGYITLGLKRDQQEARMHARQIAESLARRLDERHRAMESLLKALRAAQAGSDTLDCVSLLGTLGSPHAHVLLRIEDPTGRLACSGGELPRGEPVMSEPLLREDGTPLCVAHVAIDTRPLLESSRDTLGGRAVAGIMTRRGAVIAQLPMVDPGAPDLRAVQPARQAAPQGNRDVKGNDGVMRHYGFAFVPGTDWVAFTGISADDTSAPYYGIFLTSIGVSIAVVAIVLLLALGLARRFVRPIVELSKAASRVTQSGAIEPVHASGPLEIASLTDSFNAMVARRAESERLLAESEERYRTMLETSNEGVWAVDHRGITTFVNARFAHMLGYEPEDIIGQPALDYVPAARLKDAAEHQRSRRSGTSAVFEFPITRRDGTELWALFSATPAYRDGVYAGSFAMITDITARREAEKRLAESEERYRTIVDSAGEGLWLLDAEMRITFVNQRVVEMLGFTTDEMIGRRALDFVAPSHLDLARLQHGNRRRGRRDTFELAFLRRDRSLMWARITSTALMHGTDFRGAVALLTDITESREAEARLRRSEEALRQAQRDAALGSWSWNMVSGELQGSEEYLRMLGVDALPSAASLAELAGFVHPDDWPMIQKELDRVMAGRESRLELNARFVRSTGETFHAWLRARIEYGPDGTPLEIHGTTQDVTRLEQTRLALEQSREELRALSDRLMIAHEEERRDVARELHDDLGQSLTAIKIDLDGLASRITDDDGRRLLERARQASLETIRSVQRLSSNLRPVALDDLGFSAAVQQEARTFEQRTGIECDVSILNEEVVESSRAKVTLFRIAQEALTNIARHSGASRAELRLRWDGTDVVLEARDNGKGISPEAVESASSIGLVGMRERTAMLGGLLSVVGVPNRGTIISVRIPADRMKSE